MKKPQVKREVKPSVNYNSGTGFTLLNTLGYGQLVDLANGLSNYASKREETKQMGIHAQVEMGRIDASTKIAMVQQIASSLTSLANTGFEYASEREKTKQTAINAQIESEKTNERLTIAEREHTRIMSELKTKQKENKHQFKKDMKSIEVSATDLEKKDKAIHRILDLLEAGEISENELAGIIHALKQ